MRLLLAIVALLAIAEPAQATIGAKNELIGKGWQRTDEGAYAPVAGIGIGANAGDLELTQIKGDDLDLIAQYRAEDREIIATIFIYRPTLPNSGLAFLATNRVITSADKGLATLIGDRLVQVNGEPGRARRVTYHGYLKQGLHSVAIFVEAGPWMVKIRASGPPTRSGEIEQVADAMLAGMRFDLGREPVPITRVAVSDCDEQLPQMSAQQQLPSIGEVGALGPLVDGVVVDEEGHSVGNELGRVPKELCLYEDTVIDDIPMQIYLNPNPSENNIFNPRAFVLYGDAGLILEIGHLPSNPDQFYAVRNRIGEATIHGMFDQMLSLNQMENLAANADTVLASARSTSDGRKSGTTIYCKYTSEGCSDNDALAPAD